MLNHKAFFSPTMGTFTVNKESTNHHIIGSLKLLFSVIRLLHPGNSLILSDTGNGFNKKLKSSHFRESHVDRESIQILFHKNWF